MGNNNQTPSPQEKFSYPPNQNMGINYAGKKEDGWRNGHCTRCGKSSFMCMCTGNLKEAAWTNGKCNKCGKTTFMCNCPDISTIYFGPGPSPPPSAQQVGYIAQPMGYSGRKEDGWRDGKCTRCGKTTFMCSCTGSNREFFWKMEIAKNVEKQHLCAFVRSQLKKLIILNNLLLINRAYIFLHSQLG